MSLCSGGSANPCWACGARLSTFYAEFLCLVHTCCGARLSTFYAESMCLLHTCGEVRLSKSLLSLFSSSLANPCWVGGVKAQQILAEFVGSSPVHQPWVVCLLSQRLQRFTENPLAHQESSSPLAYQESWSWRDTDFARPKGSVKKQTLMHFIVKLNQQS